MIDLNEDMYTGCLPTIEQFTCMICYGIAFNPMKCKGCETITCKACFLVYRNDYRKNKPKCFKNCGSQEFQFRLDPTEQKILNSLTFECERCDENVPYKDYLKHCLTHDKELQLPGQAELEKM